MKRFNWAMVSLLTGMLTCMCGFPIYDGKQFSLKNLLVLIVALAIVRLIPKTR